MQIVDEKDVTALVIDVNRKLGGTFDKPTRCTHPIAFHLATKLLAERQCRDVKVILTMDASVLNSYLKAELVATQARLEECSESALKMISDNWRENGALGVENAGLRKSNALQAKEIADLKDRLARAGIFVKNAGAALGLHRP